MSNSLPPGAEEYIKELASRDPSGTINNFDWDVITDEFIKLAHPGVVNLEIEHKRRHFLTIRHSEFGKSFYGKKNEYFCEFWFELNFPVWIGVIISMFKKVVMLVNVFFRKASEFKFFV